MSDSSFDAILGGLRVFRIWQGAIISVYTSLRTRLALTRAAAQPGCEVRVARDSEHFRYQLRLT